MEGFPSSTQQHSGTSEANTPLCKCGNGFMLLRKAGKFLTLPGKYYYICLASLKHPNKFYWYDEYHKVILGSKQTYTECGGDSSSYTTQTRMHRKDTPTITPTHSSSCTQPCCDSTKAVPNETSQFKNSDNVISCNITDKDSRSNKHPTISSEDLCCCFGFICRLLCLFPVVVLCIVISK